MQLRSSRVQSGYVLEMLKTQTCRSGKPRVLPEMHVLRLNLKQKHSETSSLRKLMFKKEEKSLRQLNKSGDSLLPYFLAVFQWTLLVISIAFNMNFAVVVTGAVANGGLKVIMPFHLLIFFFSIVLSLILYRIRKEGTAERCIFSISLITLLFSIANISLHFVNDLVLLMKATEVAAWGLYNSMFSISVYKIFVVFLLPISGRFAKIVKKILHNDKELRAEG